MSREVERRTASPLTTPTRISRKRCRTISFQQSNDVGESNEEKSITSNGQENNAFANLTEKRDGDDVDVTKETEDKGRHEYYKNTNSTIEMLTKKSNWTATSTSTSTTTTLAAKSGSAAKTKANGSQARKVEPIGRSASTVIDSLHNCQQSSHDVTGHGTEGKTSRTEVKHQLLNDASSKNSKNDDHIVDQKMNSICATTINESTTKPKQEKQEKSSSLSSDPVQSNERDKSCIKALLSLGSDLRQSTQEEDENDEKKHHGSDPLLHSKLSSSVSSSSSPPPSSSSTCTSTVQSKNLSPGCRIAKKKKIKMEFSESKTIATLEAATATAITKKASTMARRDDDTVPPDFWYWFQPGESINNWDVLCGRGGESNNFIGNKKYRRFVNEKKEAYRKIPLKHRKEKTAFVRRIVQHVNNCGGRFVDHDDDSGRYYVVTMDKARKKTSQALRETKELKWLEIEQREQNNPSGNVGDGSCGGGSSNSSGTNSRSGRDAVCPYCLKPGHKTKIAKACLLHHEWLDANPLRGQGRDGAEAMMTSQKQVDHAMAASDIGTLSEQEQNLSDVSYLNGGTEMGMARARHVADEGVDQGDASCSATSGFPPSALSVDFKSPIEDDIVSPPYATV